MEEDIDKVAEAQKTYRKSKKGKDSQKRYWASDKGKETRKRYGKSVKHKLQRKKYYASGGEQGSIERRKEKVDEFKKIRKWLKDHPGKTIDDYNRENNE